MSSWFPVNLQLAGRRCLVVGGGKVALRKVLALLDFGISAVLLSPDAVPELEDLAADAKITWIKDEYREEYLANSREGYFIAVAATNRREVNRRVAMDCRRRGILVNVVDAPEEGDFSFSAYLKRGDLLLTVSSSGHSPALCRRIAEDLAREYGPEYEVFAELMAEARVAAREKIADRDRRRLALRSIAGSEALQLIKDGRKEEARKRVMECLSLYWD